MLKFPSLPTVCRRKRRWILRYCVHLLVHRLTGRSQWTRCRPRSCDPSCRAPPEQGSWECHTVCWCECVKDPCVNILQHLWDLQETCCLTNTPSTSHPLPTPPLLVPCLTVSSLPPLPLSWLAQSPPPSPRDHRSETGYQASGLGESPATATCTHQGYVLYIIH